VLKAVTIRFTIIPGLQQKIYPFIFKEGNQIQFFFSLGFLQEEKKSFFLLEIFTRRIFFNLSNKIYFSGSKKTPY